LKVVNHDRSREHWRFEEFDFALRDTRDGIVLSYRDVDGAITAYVRRDLVSCMAYVDLDYELGDYSGPPCPK
jgi:hypothetical protein